MKQEPIVASTKRPVLRRPDPPPHWKLDELPPALQAFDEALVGWSNYLGKQSLTNYVAMQENEDGSATYTLLLSGVNERKWRELAGGSEHSAALHNQLLDLSAAELGVDAAELDRYVGDLMRYWKDARASRTEFMRSLQEGDIPYEFVESVRAFGADAKMPWSDVLIRDADALTHLKAIPIQSRWSATPYR